LHFDSGAIAAGEKGWAIGMVLADMFFHPFLGTTSEGATGRINGTCITIQHGNNFDGRASRAGI
jgi:hypothetical protein